MAKIVKEQHLASDYKTKVETRSKINGRIFNTIFMNCPNCSIGIEKIPHGEKKTCECGLSMECWGNTLHLSIDESLIRQRPEKKVKHGLADCGTDSNGRFIGYAFEAECDHPGCDTRIDRGVAFSCGGMHNDNGQGWSCEKYFCLEHLHGVCDHDGVLDSPRSPQLCPKCYKEWEAKHPDCEECQRCVMDAPGVGIEEHKC